MDCYATIGEMQVAKGFNAAIDRTFNEKGGVFWEGTGDNQIASHAMMKVKEFTRIGGRWLKGSLVIGRQSNKRCINDVGDFVDINEGSAEHEEIEDYDSAPYILNEMVQVGRLV